MSNNNNNISDTFSACLTQLKTGKNNSDEGSFPYGFVVLLIGVGFIGAYFTGGRGGILKWLVLGMGVAIVMFISYVMFIYDPEEFTNPSSSEIQEILMNEMEKNNKR